MVSLDGRPGRLDATFRPDDSFTVNLTGPAGWLSSRAFTATLGGVALSVSENGDVLTVVASAAITAAATSPAQFVLTLTGGNDALVGTWSARTDGSAHTSTSAAVIIDSLDVAVTLGGDSADLNAHIADAVGAHAASAVSITDAAGDFTATDVEGALAELQTDLEALPGTYQPAQVVDAATYGDGVTDAGSHIQSKINAAVAAGGGTVFFPAGTYLCNTSGGTIGAGISYALYIRGSNVRLVFDKGATLKTSADLNMLAIAGALAPGLATFDDYYLGDPTNATYYEIDPASRGERSITTATAGDAANFAAGDKIHVRTGSLNTGTITEPDAELNEVISANAGTGVITLRYPLVKPYAQEYFISGTTGKTSTAVTANPAVFGVAKITDRTIENISIEGLTLDTAATSKSAIVVRGGLIGLNIDRLSGVVGGSPVDLIEYRWATFRDWDIHMDAADAGIYRWLVTTATSVSDVEIENLHGTGTGDRQLVGHFHEGSANVTVRGFKLVSDVGADDGNPLSVRARAYNHVYEDIDIVSGGTQSAYVDDTCIGGVTLIRPRVVIEGDTTKGLRVAAVDARILDPDPDTPIDDDAAAYVPPYGGRRLISGRTYRFPNSGLSTSAALGNGNLRVAPFYVPNRCSLDRLGLEVTSAGSAGCTIRLGIYDDQDGRPLNLVVDGGTVAGDSATAQSVTIATDLNPGWFWFGAVLQGAPASQPTVRILASTAGSMPLVDYGTAATLASGAVGLGALMTGVTGALSSTFTYSTYSGVLPAMYGRLA